MRVLLVNPPQPTEDVKSTFGKEAGAIIPYGLLCIGTWLNHHGIETEIVDCWAERQTLDDVARRVKENDYFAVGVTAFTYSIPRAYEVAEVVKRVSPETTVVIGGVHASVMPEGVLDECPACDYVVIGEGEKVLLDLLLKLEAKQAIDTVASVAYRDNGVPKRTLEKVPYIDVTELPHPDYSMLKMDRYTPHSGNYRVLPTISFYTSRGCPFPCTFCAVNVALGRTSRWKGIEQAIEELKILKRDFGVRGLIFQDSTFTIKKPWVREFCERMIEEKLDLVWRANTRVDCLDEDLLRLMKKAGCYRLNMGFESGHQETLDLLDKRTTVEENILGSEMARKVGLEVGATFMIGLPNESMAHILKTLAVAKQLQGRFAQFYLPVPYPGTALRDQCKDGVREDAAWHDYDSRDFRKAVYVNPNFNADFYRRLPEFAAREYYCNFTALRRILFYARSWSEFKNDMGIVKRIFKRWWNMRDIPRPGSRQWQETKPWLPKVDPTAVVEPVFEEATVAVEVSDERELETAAPSKGHWTPFHQ